jgi:hypothetical protein
MGFRSVYSIPTGLEIVQARGKGVVAPFPQISARSVERAVQQRREACGGFAHASFGEAAHAFEVGIVDWMRVRVDAGVTRRAARLFRPLRRIAVR